jgi:hypothetical protein
MAERRIQLWSESGGHPPEDDLRLYADGELEARTHEDVKTHLEACWTCRVELDKVQQAIADFIEYRNQALNPIVPPPPGNWRSFNLDGASQQTSDSAESIWLRLFRQMGRSVRGLQTRAATYTPLTLRTFAAIGAGAMLAFVVYLLNAERQVTAAELLRRSGDAQINEILSASQPVIHQRFHVIGRRSSQTQTAKIENWNDLNHARFRQIVDSSSLTRELEKVYRDNHLDWRRPLSTISFLEWRNSVQERRETVDRAEIDGRKAFILKTIVVAQVAGGSLFEASLAVSATDWRPFRLTLAVRDPDGERRYELLQDAVEIVSLAGVDPSIFSPPPAAAIAPPAMHSAPPEQPAPSASPTPVSADVALEIEALSLLATVGADSGEALNVARTAQGSLIIDGVVENEARKAEIRRALEKLLSNPVVHLEILTAAEAVARAAPPTTEVVEIDSGDGIKKQAPMFAVLLRRLSNEGTDSAGRAREYSDRVLNHSREAGRYAWALKRMAQRFPAAEFQRLDPASKSKLQTMLQRNAASLGREISLLRESLRPVFFAGDSTSAIDETPIEQNDAALYGVVDELFTATLRQDRIMRASFSVSNEPDLTDEFLSPDYWRSLSKIQRLAGQIQKQIQKEN